MTEDVRERFEKWHRDNYGEPDNWFAQAGRYYYGRTQELWASWQAALSSAGTSGTEAAERAARKIHDLTFQRFKAQGLRLEHRDCESKIAEVTAIIEQELRGDSLSGKGEVTTINRGSSEHVDGDTKSREKEIDHKPEPVKGEYSPAQSASAPDRAEELARKCWKIAVIDYIGEESAAVTDELDEASIDELASLLREAMGRDKCKCFVYARGINPQCPQHGCAAAPPREGG